MTEKRARPSRKRRQNPGSLAFFEGLATPSTENYAMLNPLFLLEVMAYLSWEKAFWID